MRKKKCIKCGRQYIENHSCKHYHDNKNEKNYLRDPEFIRNINSVHTIIYFNIDNHHKHASDVANDPNKSLILEKHSSSKSYHFCTICNHQLDNCHCHITHMKNDHNSYSLSKDALCNKHFKIRIGGLTDGITYQFWKLRGNYITITMQEENKQKKITGKVNYVGGNYIQLTNYQNENQNNANSSNEQHVKHESSIILPFNRIIAYEKIDG